MPKIRISNPVIAPDVLVDWEVGTAEDEGATAVALVTTAARVDGALLAVILGTAMTDELIFGMDDGIVIEDTKDGGGTALEGSASEPFPQGIAAPSG